MYRLTILTDFAAAHNLINYQGDCENLHGHNWKVEVRVSAKELNNAGLGIDFKILKKETKQLLGALDHKYLNDLPMFKGVSPSSEHICKYLYDELGIVLNDDNITIECVTVWESDRAYASYSAN
jgi:6-pyruvoyltetrahydropterin/6-carboxytetrahydropterin synthase